MKFYQLSAKGFLACIEGSKTFHSKNIFKTKEQAEDYIEKFKQAVINPLNDNDMFYLSEKGLVIRVLELELEEEN